MKTTELIFNGVNKLSEKIWNSKGYKVALNIDFDEYKLSEECIQHLRGLQDETLNNVLEIYDELKQKTFEMANELLNAINEIHNIENAIKFIKENEN